MNETELEQFERLIHEKLDELDQGSVAGRDAQAVVELDQQSVGRLSRMDALQNQAMAKAQQARRDIETRRLMAALQRIEHGEFGCCEDCGDEIAPQRLKLDPAACKCVSCASG